MLLAMVIAAQVAAVKTENVSDQASALVTHAGKVWQVEYILPRKASAWVFPVSQPKLADHKPWRQGTWQVVTPGVSIERRGAYDVLLAAKGRYVPPQVKIAFTPTNATLDREYDPAVTFSTGAVALYSDQFDLAAVDDPATIAAKDAGLSIEDFDAKHLPIRFDDEGAPVFVQGRRQINPLLTGAATYVVFGAGEVQTLGGVAMLADPALPAWLKTDISQFAPRVASDYAARLGSRNDPSLPLLLMGWRGATPGKVINDGGVRPGEILLNFEGEGLLDRNERAVRRTRWFIGHEMAHFWLGSEGVGYQAPSDAWITEGGAEMMVLTMLAASDHDYVMDELQRAVDDCIKLGTKPIARAADRNESRAFYACGTVFALAASGVARHAGGADFFDFIKPLLARHRSDPVLGGDEWIRYFETVSQTSTSGNAIRLLVEQGSDHPAKAVEAILRSGHIPLSSNGAAVVLAPTAI
jgi:hypothetical protein